MKNILSCKYLNAEQEEVYYNIKDQISNKKNVVITIDTPSGTGKTFVLSLLANKYKDSIDYIVFRKDQASQLSLSNVTAFTYVSYNMYQIRLGYSRTLTMFNMSKMNSLEILYELIVYSLQIAKVDALKNTIILDSYTIASPIMILLLYIVSLKNHMNLIFAGNVMQPGAICKTRTHNRSNFYIIQIFSDLIITKLTTNMRSHDENFMSKVSRFREMIESYKPEGEVKFYFSLRYMLYCLFRPKYFTDERFDTIYMSQYHHDIMERLYRFIDHLKSNDIKYILVPFRCKYKGKLIELPLNPENKKFFPGLLLVKGYKYIYMNATGNQNIVILEDMIFVDTQLDTVVVRFEDDSSVEKIKCICLNYYQILPAYRAWLLTNLPKYQDLYQFPLRMYTLTYHAALGKTIETESVEISANCIFETSNANCIYSGLCCMPSDSSIHKIHATKDLINFLVTDYMENERNDKNFYYRCPENEKYLNKIIRYASTEDTKTLIDRIQWTDTDSIIEFEKKSCKKYLRIPRSAYKQSGKEKTTSLMKVARFMKDKPNVIHYAIDKARIERSKDTDKKKEKSSKKSKSEAYIYLEKEYQNWVDSNKNK